MKLETRVFNRATKKMFYMSPIVATGNRLEAVANSFGVEFDMTDPVMLKTSMQDINKWLLYEGDIVECGIATSYGVVKDKGVVVWRADMGRFTINIQTAYEGQTNFDVVDVKYIGNIYENEDIINEKQAYAKTEVKKE